jgi:hypothetical protein
MKIKKNKNPEKYQVDVGNKYFRGHLKIFGIFKNFRYFQEFLRVFQEITV